MSTESISVFDGINIGVNYEKIYRQLIDNRKRVKPSGYKEKHHILPKCMGGKNSNSNLVFLTAREHYVCHKLLTKFVDDKFKAKMIYAWHMMTVDRGNRKVKITSNDYAILREQHTLVVSNRKISKQTRKKMSAWQLGKVPWNKGKTGIYSAETIKKMSAKRTGTVSSKHTKKKISLAISGSNNPMFGKSHTIESKKKMTEAKIGANHPKFGKKFQWVFNPTTNSMKSIIHEDLEKYLLNGFRKGRK